MRTLIFLIFTYSSVVLAQPESRKINISGAGIVLPKQTKEKNISNSDLFKTPLNLPTISKPNLGFNSQKPNLFNEKSNINLSNNNNFSNPNEGLLDKLNKKGLAVTEDFKAVRGNQDFGVFALESKFVTIKCRDFGEIDGDLVRILVNGIVIENSVFLDSYYKDIEIFLVKGFNKIEIEALTQGTSGPNTADFKIYDDKGKVIALNQWNLATGFKASIMVTKE